ncbi:MAG: GNAT family N-acetyltransferase [Thermomicrobiales bacterium]
MTHDENPEVDDLSGWTARPFPPRTPMTGERTRLEPVSVARHGDALWDAVAESDDPDQWTWLPYGPFTDRDAFLMWLADREASADPQFHAIVDGGTGRAMGMCSFMRIDAANGVLEIGHIWFSPAIQRSTMATEAIFFLMRRTFDELGYRRLEWKCDNANVRSKRAAARFGFTPEGVFRKHLVTKGRNRDTAWFSLLDDEWPMNRAVFTAWLAPENFTEDGAQIRSLGEIRASLG